MRVGDTHNSCSATLRSPNCGCRACCWCRRPAFVVVTVVDVCVGVRAPLACLWAPHMVVAGGWTAAPLMAVACPPGAAAFPTATACAVGGCLAPPPSPMPQACRPPAVWAAARARATATHLWRGGAAATHTIFVMARECGAHQHVCVIARHISKATATAANVLAARRHMDCRCVCVRA